MVLQQLTPPLPPQDVRRGGNKARWLIAERIARMNLPGTEAIAPRMPEGLPF